MTVEIGLVLFLLGAAVFLFATEWLPVDVVTLLLLGALILTGLLTPPEAFSGFASDIVIILCSVFVLSRALTKTGAFAMLTKLILRLGGRGYRNLLAAIMSFTAGASAFMNNTTATASFLPSVLTAGRVLGWSPSKLLIPMAFASMLGGTVTLIGTSTNVAVSGYLEREGLEPFSLFEFSPIGLLLVVTGILYMSILGHRLLPSRESETYGEQYHIKEFLFEVLLKPSSPFLGSSIEETLLAERGVTVLEVMRGAEKLFAQAGLRLQAGDVLIVKGGRESLLEVQETDGFKIQTEGEVADQDLVSEEIKMVEAVVPPQSTLAGKSLRELDFRQRFGMTALAIYRSGHVLAEPVNELPLHFGDVLLLQGPRDRLASLRQASDLWILQESSYLPGRRRKGVFLLIFFVAAVVLAATRLLDLPVAFLLAALSAVLTRCVSMEEAYQLIEWRLIVLIAGMTAFGLAMESTGTAQFLAATLLEWMQPWGVSFVLAGLAALTMALTQPMSNAAAALVMLPVALATAEQLAVDQRSVAVLIALAASVSFITPFEPSCLLVYGAGKYRFVDFIRAGLPLTILLLVILVLVVPLFWPL